MFRMNGMPRAQGCARGIYASMHVSAICLFWMHHVIQKMEREEHPEATSRF